MDPVFQYTNSDDKWYFWDESWSLYYGPFDFEENARHFLNLYVKYLSDDNEGSAKEWKHSELIASNVRWRNF